MKNRKSVIIPITLSSFVLMLGYETSKELLFKGTLTPWQSHWITIIFTTMVTLVATLLASKMLISLREKTLQVEVKAEKIKSIKQVMRVVQHHVNNLAHNLGIVKLEIETYGNPRPETLELLQQSIEETAQKMKLLGDVNDPYDEHFFDIRFE